MRNVNKRLLPLYIAAFFQGFVLWYAIEKLFMRGIGFDDAAIGVMAAVYAGVMLLVETPSGILADRWSRKNVLILASIFLAGSSILCGLSTGIPLYLLGAVSWGVFYAFYSGTYESIIYDTLVEETGKGEGFEKYYGRIRIIDSAALFAGSLIGGLVGQYAGLNAVYFWTVPLAVFSMIALFKFKEPMLHKAEVTEPIKKHIEKTFNAVLKNKRLIAVLAVLIATSVVDYLLYEFSQLWLIAIALPVVLFGPASAIILSTPAIGGWLANYKKLRLRPMLTIMLAIALVCSIVLTMSRNFAVIIGVQAIIGVVTIILEIVFTKLLHDSLPSQVRAGAASAVSTMGKIVFIPCALVFGYLSTHYTTFTAGWILVGFLALSLFFMTRTKQL